MINLLINKFSACFKKKNIELKIFQENFQTFIISSCKQQCIDDIKVHSFNYPNSRPLMG